MAEQATALSALLTKVEGIRVVVGMVVAWKNEMLFMMGCLRIAFCRMKIGKPTQFVITSSSSFSVIGDMS